MKQLVRCCALLLSLSLLPFVAHAAKAKFCELPYEEQALKRMILDAAFVDTKGVATFRLPGWKRGYMQAVDKTLLSSAEYRVLQAVFHLTHQFQYDYFGSAILNEHHDALKKAPSSNYSSLLTSNDERVITQSHKLFKSLNERFPKKFDSFRSDEIDCLMAVTELAPRPGFDKSYTIRNVQGINSVEKLGFVRFTEITGCAAKSLLYYVGYENAVTLPDELVIPAVGNRGKLFPKSVNQLFVSLLEMAVLLAERSKVALTYSEAEAAITQIIEKECE